MVSHDTRSIDVNGKHHYDGDFHIISNKIMKLDDIVEKVHPMKHIFVASIVQVIMLILMGVSMLTIGYFFK